MARPAPSTLDPQELQEQLDANLKQEQWKRYRCTLVTPMYGGGVKAGEVDVAMPIRATEIRGQLRFWWRLLNRKKYPDTQELFKAERAIWGGLGDEDTLAKSKVAVMVSKQPGFKTQPSKEAKAGIKYVFGQGEVQWLSAPQKFEIRLQYPASLELEVASAFQWWANFGGLGAKTRRGFGAVQVHDVTAVSDQELQDIGCMIARAETTEDELSAWQNANNKLHQFRQMPGIARARGGERPGRSFWPEPDQLRRDFRMDDDGKHKPMHQAGNVFGRAAFGLPIIFDFRKSSEPAKTELLPAGDKERMASPLILRPCIHNGRWTATALLLPNWKEALHQPLRYKSGNGTPMPWPKDEKEQKRIASTIAPMVTNDELRGSNPLTAFMAYFAEHQSDATKVAAIKTAIIGEITLEGARLKFNRGSGTLSAEKSGQSYPVEVKEKSLEILNNLSDEAKKKVMNGDQSLRFTVNTKGRYLIKVEETK